MKARIAVLLGALVATASLAVGATAAPSEPSAQSATIVGVAAGDKRFSTLVALVKQAGLVKTLNGKGPFTVFAPTNARSRPQEGRTRDTTTPSRPTRRS